MEKRKKATRACKKGEPTITVCLRMAQSQRAKLAKLGGAAWMRDRIDRAKVSE
jgi:hypothetical protein